MVLPTLVLGMTARFHLPRRCCSTYNSRLNDAPIFEHCSVECLNALTDISVHLHQVIWDRRRFMLN